MAKLVKVSDSKAYRISVIRMADDKEKTTYLSIRQMYKTKKEPDEWKPGYQGITISMDIGARIIKALIAVFKDKDAKIEVIKKKEK